MQKPNTKTTDQKSKIEPQQSCSFSFVSLVFGIWSLVYEKRHNSSFLILNSRARGFGIVEIIVGAAILSVALGGLVAAMRIAVRASYDNLGKTQANFLLTEGVEAVRALRDASWSANIAGLADSSTYYLYFNGTKWATTSAEQVIDGAFYRKFSVYNVYRDGSDNIAASGTADSGTRKAVVSVAWRAGKSTTTLQTTTYITNLFSN